MGKGIEDKPAGLIRGISLPGATALNMIDMIGVGPFITIPLMVSAMGGPQAMLGWILGAILAMSDGLVWAELGAAMPNAGGSYKYLKEIYGREKLGKLASFLYIFQLSFSAPLSIASGCVGLAMYASYLFPGISTVYTNHLFRAHLPLLGSLEASISIGNATFVSIGICLVAVLLLYRNIGVINKISQYLWVGVILTILWVIVSGVSNFDSKLAFNFPPDAFKLTPNFFMGLGAAMLISIYDYWGYYNVCFIGGEIKNPGKNIPRAIIYSILAVAVIYIIMNTSILGVLPWQAISDSAGSDARKYIISLFMQKIYGNWAGELVSVLIMWTAFASVFSLLLGYSRVPYAAAVEGDYFKPFARIHPKNNFPNFSLIVMGIVACLFCFLQLRDIIAALVVIRITIQFLAQTIGVIIFRITGKDVERPFRMWLFPLPAILAFAGFVYVLVSRENFLKEFKYAVILIIIGLILYAWRSYRKKEWPFRKIANAN